MRSNTAKYGGGLYAGSGGGDVALTISNSLLQDNTAHRTGGGIFAYAGKGSELLLTVEDSTLSGNRVTSYVGGAIFSATYQGYIATRINRSTISGNHARDGAGFFNEGSSEGGGQAQAIIKNSTFPVMLPPARAGPSPMKIMRPGSRQTGQTHKAPSAARTCSCYTARDE